MRRYGPECAVCGIALPEVLETAHVRPKEHDGSDDPRNGLVLCATHHRAFDAGLFAIEPDTLAVHSRPDGPSLQELRISRSSIAELPRKPHREALTWRWGQWEPVLG
jgi:predicted restriction endonuclease